MSCVRSMTGFATADGETSDGRAVSVTVKSVNHRHFDLQLRLPMGCDALEAPLRALVKEHCRRGHVELMLTLTKAACAPSLALDEPLLAATVDAYKRAATLLGVSEEVDLNVLLRMPGMLVASLEDSNIEDARASVLATTERGLARWNEAREAEGKALAETLDQAMQRVSTLAAEARTLRAGVGAAQWVRLKNRIAELGVTVGEDRLLVEAALLVERGDVEEELVRLVTHVERFRAHLLEGGELGRALDFLLQELNREANTLLAKTGASCGEAGLRLTEIGLAIKLELERSREQVQNLE